jgi:hypothetical protein
MIEQERHIPNEADESLSFSGLLRHLFERSGMSMNQLAHRSFLDVAYIHRLIRQEYDPLNQTVGDGRKVKHPWRDAVIRLGLALNLAIEDIDMLLLSAGYAPPYPLVLSSCQNQIQVLKRACYNVSRAAKTLAALEILPKNPEKVGMFVSENLAKVLKRLKKLWIPCPWFESRPGSH